MASEVTGLIGPTSAPATPGSRLPGSLPGLLSTSLAVAVVLGYWRLVSFSVYTSDSANYWSDSINWRDPFNQYHLPGYPLLLALARGVSGGAIPRVGLMSAISVGALLAGVHATHTLATEVGLSRRAATTAACAFGLWPFVGITYAAFPVSDPLALTLLLWGTIFFLRRWSLSAALALGLAAVTHKALWPAIGVLVIGQALVRGKRGVAIASAAVAVAPLLALSIAGTVTGSSAAWLVSASAEDAARPLGQRSLHVLDGLVGSDLYGDWVQHVRLVIVLGVVLLAASILTSHVRRWREPVHLAATVFAAQIIFLALTLNQHLVWAAVRFSGLLAVPTACAASRAIDGCNYGRWRRITRVAFVVLIATQVLTAAEGARRNWAGTL